MVPINELRAKLNAARAAIDNEQVGTWDALTFRINQLELAYDRVEQELLAVTHDYIETLTELIAKRDKVNAQIQVPEFKQSTKRVRERIGGRVPSMIYTALSTNGRMGPLKLRRATGLTERQISVCLNYYKNRLFRNVAHGVWEAIPIQEKPNEEVSSVNHGGEQDDLVGS